MKTFYLTTLILLSFSAYTQKSIVSRDVNTFKSLKYNFPKQQNSYTNKALGDTLWSDNFDDPTTWIIDNDNQLDPYYGWNINATSEAWYNQNGFPDGINSISGGNFAEVQNGNMIGHLQAIDVVYNLTTASSIDINDLTQGDNLVFLQFEQFGALNNDNQSVLISTDGANWTEVYSNNQKAIFEGNNTSAIYPNPELVSVNISNAIQSDPTSVWIRFSWTSNFPDSTQQDWWTTYGWYIDDVKIVEALDNDLTLNNASMHSGNLGLPYYILPQFFPLSSMEFNFSGSITNNGKQTQTNVILDVTVDGTTHSSPIGNDIAVLNSDTLFTTTSFTPNASIGSYPINYSLTSDITDDNPIDNSKTDTLNISNFIYARDKAGLYGTSATGSVSNWLGAADYEAFSIGNVFEIMTNSCAGSIDVKLSGSVPNGGAIVYCRIYKYDTISNEFYFYGETEDNYITNTSQITNIQTFVLNYPIDLFQGEIILVFAGHYGEEISFATSGKAPEGSVLGFDGQGNLITPTTPENIVVRINFDPDPCFTFINENESNIIIDQNFPNPYNGNTQVNYTLTSTEDVMVEITDLTGKVIAVMNEGVRTAGSHTLTFNSDNMAAGTYFYTLSTSKGKVTKSMVVAK